MFYIRGNLYPHKRIKLSLDEFEDFFVKSFSLDSSRVELFEGYLKFIGDFKREVSPNFTQWIDGSFVSNKENPNDIDFVTLIKAPVYQKKRLLIDNKFRLAKGKEFYSVDAYTVELYPKDHAKYLAT